MNERLKQRTHWAVLYGLPRASLRLSARLGNPTAKLLIDTDRVGDIYTLIEQIRADGRLVQFGKTWVTADSGTARAIFRDRRFITLKPEDKPPLQRWLVRKSTPDVLNPIAPPSILFTDPPDHTRLRRLISAPFTPRAVENLRNRIQELTDQRIADLERSDAPDLITDYAARIPIAVIGDLLAVPEDEHPELYDIMARAIKMIATGAPTWADYREANRALGEMDEYLEMHIDRLRHGKPDSVISPLLHASELSYYDIKLFAAVLLGAGFVTTTHLMGKGMVTLLRHPDQLHTLRANPDRWVNAVEEVIRHDTSNQWSARLATEDVTIGGQRIEAGESALLLLGGANRDPAVFKQPERFDIARPNAHKHLTFGSGVHVCLGLTLARIELHIALRTLFERFPEMELAGDPTFHDGMGIHGYRNAPVHLGRPSSGKPCAVSENVVPTAPFRLDD